MESNSAKVKGQGFGTAPVFFTAISTILGAILFLRFGFAVGTLGFWGVILIIFLGHLVSFPTALAISELATNQRVEGGGEYFIISRSFGLNIGATIGIVLFFAQAISVAFYVIAFAEAFQPFFEYVHSHYGIILPHQVISLPSMALLSILILKKGAAVGVKALYFVVGILFLSLFLFFIGKTDYSQVADVNIFSDGFKNMDKFFIVFAICFPAFTGMSAGLGLSGDLKNPGKSIPLGTISATVVGMIVYVLVTWKLAVSASPYDLLNNQLIMSKIAKYGGFMIPLGLAASTISSALGSIMVAPRTLQALASDKSFPLKFINNFFAKGKPQTNEPFNASVITIIIAFVFVALGNVNAVAKIITMFFMLDYGSICLISFLNHFGASPSYRPSFKSRWYFSLIGFLFSVWFMFKISPVYSLLAFVIIIVIYLSINYYHKDRKGLETIFQGALFQINRSIQVYLQRTKKIDHKNNWRPAAVCVSTDSFVRDKALILLSWISHKYGFGTYIHLIEGYYSKAIHERAKQELKKLVENSEKINTNVFIDTMISPSYTSAIAQIIQLPGISGLDNNMIIFEFDKQYPVNLDQIIDNYSLVRAGNYDVCVLASSNRKLIAKNGIHIWIRNLDTDNYSLMILMSYIIIGHPDWKKGKIKIFDICEEDKVEDTRKQLSELIRSGRLPISKKNIEIIKVSEGVSSKSIINEKSADAGLTFIGFIPEQVKHSGKDVFKGFDNIGDVLFVNAFNKKEIE